MPQRVAALNLPLSECDDAGSEPHHVVSKTIVFGSRGAVDLACRRKRVPVGHPHRLPGSVVIIVTIKVFEHLERGLNVSAPCFDPLTDCEECDDERGDGISPPPAEQ